jgi:hypothetical protein
MFIAAMLALATALPSAPPDPADQIGAYVQQLEKTVERQHKEFKAFATGVYSPYCGAHGAPTTVKLIDSAPYPALLVCADGTKLSVPAPKAVR